MRVDLRELVDDAVRELSAWQESEPDGVKRSRVFYRDLEAKLLRLKADRTVDVADWLYHDVMRHIMKSGPIASDFVPSLERISARIADLRKR